MTGPQPDAPVPFGARTSWFAVRSEDGPAVAASFGITELERSPWAAGLEASYAGGTFVTPPLGGWTLVVGEVAPDLDQARGQWGLRLAELSERFGEAQLFATHRVVELHMWARARAGDVERAFCYLGESGAILYDEGQQSAEEIDLGFDFVDPAGEIADAGENRFPGEDSVLSLSGSWSLSPAELSASSAPPGLGWIPARPRRPWWRFW